MLKLVSDNEVMKFITDTLPIWMYAYCDEVEEGVISCAAANWCRENLGPNLVEACDLKLDGQYWWGVVHPDARWECWDEYGYTFFFRDEKDATLFKLTWGGKGND
jgi:hypothetical protein